MTTYRVDGIDCPVCAQGIEDGLKKLEGVRAVTLDFATLTLHVDALDIAVVEAEARRIEPGIGLVSLDHAEAGAAEPGQRRDLAIVSAAALLALAAWFFESRLPGLPLWLRPLPYFAAWLLAGWEVLAGALRNIGRGRVFDELFLMSIATIGALVIGQYEEAVGVMVFYRVGELLQERSIARSRSSIRALLDRRPERARVLRSGDWSLVPAGAVVAGDLVRVLPGEVLPVDGLVRNGESLLDTRSLTGEAAPRDVAPGSEVLGGFIAIDGALEIEALRPVAESQAARIASLVEGASARKARTERVVTSFARWYTPLVVTLASLVAFLPPLLVPGARLADWGYRALVMLVISCPCALVISVPLGYFAALGAAAGRGILVKGGEVLDTLARVDRVVFDKTGTLTEGSFEVVGIRTAPGRSQDEVLALAAGLESRSGHLIAKALVRAAASRGLPVLDDAKLGDFREYPGKGVVATIGGRRHLAGNLRLLAELAPGAVAPPGEGGGTSVHLAVEGVWAGEVVLGDRLRPDAVGTVAALRRLGVRELGLLSGDSEGPVRELASRLGLDRAVHGLTPEGKLRELESMLEAEREGGKGRGALMFVGDGTNDAPVLARADVGAAMGAGTDAAVETADLVLVSSEPARVPEAIALARRTRSIVIQNIVFALGVKSAFLALGALGLAGMWVAVIGDVGVALLAVLNSMRALAGPRPSGASGAS